MAIKKITLVFILCSLFTTISSFAQQDILLKKSGEELRGAVMKISNNEITFVYQNEAVEYIIPKNDVVKVTFASGRVEFFTLANDPSHHNLEDHHNKVAILPFGYVKEQEYSNQTMQKKIQSELHGIFKSKAVSLKFQDIETTNSLLYKAGISNNNLDGYTMGEIANILGVEYVVQGLVSIEKTFVANVNASSSNYDNKNNKTYVDRNGNIVGDIWNTGNKGKSQTGNIGTEIQNYATNITMSVYTDAGDKIFSKDHQSFWNTQDAYKITLDYLAKRTPIYKR